MDVVATAGHVDHGKSTLVRALTGMEPDRWAEERRRGMTIDLGYAWTLIGGRDVVFVDVPGHERFLPNTLAGLGPAPAVLFVVAADQGWQEQSTEHLAAVRALGTTSLLVAVTRSDLADPCGAAADARRRLLDAGIREVRTVAVSATTGAGLDELRAALVTHLDARPRPPVDGRVRLWIDRAFTVTGAGTVVTGTLQRGRIAVGDELAVAGLSERGNVRVRGLQVTGTERAIVEAPARVAVNLRGVDRSAVGRGSALVTPGAWWTTVLADVRVDDGVRGERGERGPLRGGERVLHIGTAAVPVHVRPLAPGLARLRAAHPLPLAAGDRAVLRDPGSRAIAGVRILDADPPAFTRRGAAARRALELAGEPDAGREVARRGSMTREHLLRLGFAPPSDGVESVGPWLVDAGEWSRWQQQLRDTVAEHGDLDPLAPGVTGAAAARSIGLPDEALLRPLARAAGLDLADGVVRRPGAGATLGAAEPAVARIEQRLCDEPFAAPEQPELVALGLGRRELTVAVRAGRLLRLPGDVVLLPDAPGRAVELLRALAQPFTTSQARAALGTTRRVVIPLLEHLDAVGRTERVDERLRRLR